MSRAPDEANTPFGTSSSASGSLSAQLESRRARQAAAESSRRGSDPQSVDSSDEEEQSQEAMTTSQTRRIAEDLLPSPTSSPPRLIADAAAASLDKISQNSRVKTHQRPGKTVTVKDIQNRNCWICSDGDEGDVASTRRWVHPCKCSLIAHETCLLTWIRSKRASGSPDPNRIITCPQCSHPYTIFESKPVSLQIFEFGDGIVRNIVPLAGAGVVGGGIAIAATAYGCSAIRLWMGEKAARRTLGGNWPWHFYFDIPLIPFALILSRLRFLDRAMMWLPTIVAFPITHMPFASATLSWTQPYAPTWSKRNARQAYLAPARIYPPGPALTILLVPWVRVVYLSLKRKITRRILSKFVRKPRHSNNDETQRQRGETRRRVIVVGTENHLVDAAGLGDVGVDAQGQPRDVPPGADAVDDEAHFDIDNEEQAGDGNAVQQTIYVTPQSLGRLCLGALSTPFIANVMGKLLAKLAGFSYWLRRFLGMKSPIDLSFDPSVTSSKAKSPLARLFSSGSPVRKDVLDDRLLYGHYDDLDPVWFRNAIGAGLFIVAKDAMQLSFRYLRLSHASAGTKRTTILDRPFEGSMIDSLDLREGANV